MEPFDPVLHNRKVFVMVARDQRRPARQPHHLITTLESGMGREDRYWQSSAASRTVASHRAATESRRLF